MKTIMIELLDEQFSLVGVDRQDGTFEGRILLTEADETPRYVHTTEAFPDPGDAYEAARAWYNNA